MDIKDKELYELVTDAVIEIDNYRLKKEKEFDNFNELTDRVRRHVMNEDSILFGEDSEQPYVFLDDFYTPLLRLLQDEGHLKETGYTYMQPFLLDFNDYIKKFYCDLMTMETLSEPGLRHLVSFCCKLSRQATAYKNRNNTIGRNYLAA